VLFQGNKGERDPEGPISVVARQQDRGSVSISNRVHVMEDNPELIGGELQQIGKVNRLWELPEIPKEEKEYTYLIGATLSQFQKPAEK